MKQMPNIEKFMTPMPHTVNSDVPMKFAKDLMRTHGIRHLPVQTGGRLVGVVTDRDVKLAHSFGFSDMESMKVEEIMTPEPYCVEPGTPLDTVAQEMAEHKYGCAIIQQKNGKVVGIFTATDGLRAFAEVLNTRYKSN